MLVVLKSHRWSDVEEIVGVFDSIELAEKTIEDALNKETFISYSYYIEEFELNKLVES